MKKLKYSLVLMIIGLISFGNTFAEDLPESQLQGKWVLKSINNRSTHELFTNKIPTLMFNFDIDQISGNSGCNNYSGKFNYSGGSFEAPNIASGQISCPGSSDEELLVKLFNKSSKLSILNGELIFTQDDKPVLVFYRAKPLTNADLTGVWKLQSLEGKMIDTDFATKNPTLEFYPSGNRISGSAGCNDYTANYSLSNNVIDIKPLITTRMSCDKIDGETQFVKAFTDRMDIDIENNVLILRKDNKEVMTFVH